MREGSPEIRREVEEGLGSKGRLRIIGVLSERPGELFTRYALERRTGIRSAYIKSDLATLIRIGWAKETKFYPRKYQINLDNPRARKVAELLRMIGYA